MIMIWDWQQCALLSSQGIPMTNSCWCLISETISEVIQNVISSTYKLKSKKYTQKISLLWCTRFITGKICMKLNGKYWAMWIDFSMTVIFDWINIKSSVINSHLFRLGEPMNSFTQPRKTTGRDSFVHLCFPLYWKHVLVGTQFFKVFFGWVNPTVSECKTHHALWYHSVGLTAILFQRHS